MSSRALRRELVLKPDDSEINDEYKDESIVVEKKSNFNPFSLLGEMDNEEDEEDVEKEENLQDDDAKLSVSNSNNTKKPSSTPKSKKKKKKSKKKKNPVELTVPDFDNALEDIKKALPPPSIIKKVDESEKKKFLFTVEAQHLDADSEVKRLFGTGVLSDDSHSQRKFRMIKTLLATQKEPWPKISSTGIRMEQVNRTVDTTAVEKDVDYFAFKQSANYQNVQFQFMSCVNSYDPNTIVALLQVYPYHVDGLLQLSDIYKTNGEIVQAGDLVERAIYVMERGFHSNFNLGLGKSRLLYAIPQNRSFHHAIFRKINFLGRRGCYRTAFEFCKILLTLDPINDPIGGLQFIDFYALKSGQNAYLLNMYYNCEEDLFSRLQSLPNILYSIALAKFQWERTQLGTSKRNKKQTRNDFNMEGMASSEELLREAINMFPGVIPTLLEKCSATGQARLTSGKFSTCDLEATTNLRLLEVLYVERNFSLWKEPEVLAWLLEIIRKVNLENEESSSISNKDISELHSLLSFYRHLVLSEYPSLLKYIPKSLMDTVQSYDPFPPEEPTSSSWHREGNTIDLDDSNNFLANLIQRVVGLRERDDDGGSTTSSEMDDN